MPTWITYPLTTSADGARRIVTVFDAASGRALIRWPSPHESLGALSPTGKLLAIGNPDRLSVLSLGSPATTVLPGADDYVYGLAWAPNGKTLWARNFDLTSRGYDVAEGTVILDVPAPGPGSSWGGQMREAILTWGLSADGGQLVATHGHELANDSHGMRVSTHDLDSGGEWREIPGVGWDATRTNGLQDLFTLPRTSRLEFLRATEAIGPSEAPLEDLAVTRRSGSSPRVHSDPSGQLLVGRVATYIERVDGKGRVPLLIGGRALPFDERAPPTGAAFRDAKHSDVSFSPDGRLLAAVRPQVHDGVVVHDVASGDSVVELLTGLEAEDVFYAVAFSPDGRRLAVGGTDRVVSLFDTANWQLVARLEGHIGYIKDIAWSPDGATLATASGDGSVRLWHSNSLAERTAAAHAAAARREEQRAWVAGLFEELDDPHAVADMVRAATDLNDDQRHAALRVVRELATAWWEKQAAAEAKRER